MKLKQVKYLILILIFTCCSCAQLLNNKATSDVVGKTHMLRVPSKLNLSAVKDKVPITIYSSTDIRKILKADFASRDIDYDKIPKQSAFDSKYLGYPEKVINLYYKLIPRMGSHMDNVGFLVESGLIKKNEGSDCDNNAEWRSAWMHYSLPMAGIIELSGWHTKGGHRWMGVITNDGKVIWFGGTPEKYNRFDDILIKDFSKPEK